MLRQEILKHGSQNLIFFREGSANLRMVARHSVSRMTGSLWLFFWILMVLFANDDFAIDHQRRKHPMWEWLLSHPAPPGAYFFGANAGRHPGQFYALECAVFCRRPVWGCLQFFGRRHGIVYHRHSCNHCPGMSGEGSGNRGYVEVFTPNPGGGDKPYGLCWSSGHGIDFFTCGF